MSLFEFNLEKPAFKRVAERGTDHTSAADGAEAPDAEPTDAEAADTADERGSRRRPGIRTVALLATVVAVLVIRRWRS